MKPPPWIKPNKSPHKQPGYTTTIVAIDRARGIITVSGPVNLKVNQFEILNFDVGQRLFIPFMDLNPNA